MFPGGLIDLDRVSPTENRCRGPALALQEIVAAQMAGRTIATGSTALDLQAPPGILPDVQADQVPVDAFQPSGQDLQGLGHLQRGHQVDGRRQHSRRVAGGRGSRRWRGLEDTAQTGSPARNDCHGQALASHRGSVNPGDSLFLREVVQQKAGLEVVGAVQNAIGTLDQGLGVAIVEVLHPVLHGYRGVDGLQAAPGGDRLGKALTNILFREQGLPLQVALLDKVPIDQAESSDACTGQRLGLHRSQSPAADDDHVAAEQAFLSGCADFRKEDLAGIAGWKIRHEPYSGGRDRPEERPGKMIATAAGRWLDGQADFSRPPTPSGGFLRTRSAWPESPRARPGGPGRPPGSSDRFR